MLTFFFCCWKEYDNCDFLQMLLMFLSCEDHNSRFTLMLHVMCVNRNATVCYVKQFSMGILDFHFSLIHDFILVNDKLKYKRKSNAGRTNVKKFSVFREDYSGLKYSKVFIYCMNV